MSGRMSRNKGKSGERERRRIIIDNRSGISDLKAMLLVQSVVEQGRISNGGYCYVTTFKNHNNIVVARKNKASDSFLITEGQGE